MPQAQATGALEHYEHYWYVARGLGKESARQRQRKIRDKVRGGTWGGAGDPLGSQTPAAQDRLLGHLAGMAAGRIDDWESLIDPTLSYETNKSTLIDHGAQKPKTQRRREARDAWNDGKDRAKDHARETIRENFDAIEVGEKDQLVEDIGDEYGEEFVAAELEAIRVSRVDPDDAKITPTAEPEPDPAPEPTPATPPTPIDEPKGVDPAPVSADAERRSLFEEVVDLIDYLASSFSSDDREPERTTSVNAGGHGSVADNIQQINQSYS